MRTLTAIFLIFAFGIAEADARKRKYRYRAQFYTVIERPPQGFYDQRSRYRGSRSFEFDRRGGRSARMPARGAPSTVPNEASGGLAPPDWQLQPADPNWRGRRYVSPDGTAWVAFYAAPADAAALAAHMKTVAFVDGEEITYLRGERDWIVASGQKGDRLFYRKAVLACGGKRWHHIALEYPQEARRELDRYVSRLSRTLNELTDNGCETAVSAQTPQPQQ